MKRSFRTTTALAASLSLLTPQVATVAQAQQAADGENSMFCLDATQPPCPEGQPEQGTPFDQLPAESQQSLQDSGMAPQSGDAQAEADAEAAAAAEAEAQAAADAEAAAAEEQAAADAAAAEEQAAADAEAAAAEEQAAAEAQAAADAEAAAAEEQAAADAAAAEEQAAAEAQAEADAQAAEQAAADEQAAAEAESAEQAAAEQAAADEQAAAEAQAEADAQAAADEQAAADAEAAEAQAAADKEAAAEAKAAEIQAASEAEAAEEQAAADAEAQAAADAEAEAAADADAQAANEAKAAERQAAADAKAAERQAAADAKAAERQAAADARAAERGAEAEADMVDPTVEEDAQPVAAAAAADGAGAEAEVTEQTISDENSRQSDEEFQTAVDGDTAVVEGEASAEAETDAKRDDDNGLSTFQKALLLGIGAVAVGSLLKNGDEVVSNTGDRVVVRGQDGLTIYRDDDALLRQPGSDIRTETFSDGSTRSTLAREDGSQVVTIRDARGRVLRRTRVFADGTEVQLFDDLIESQPVDVRSLREVEPAPIYVSVADADREALVTALRSDRSYDPGRTFSLRQIREIESVRTLMPGIDLDTLTFDTGSAAISADQTRSLVDMGMLIEEALAENPREVFLIEGHTDATGGDSYNLALSDRRAETVALALTENFNIAPENLVVQGYGEQFLKIESQSSEAANRRATVRRITPLLQQVASNN